MNDFIEIIADLVSGNLRYGVPLIPSEDEKLQEQTWIDFINKLSFRIIEKNAVKLSPEKSLEELDLDEACHFFIEHCFRSSFPYDEPLIQTMGSSYFDGRINGWDKTFYFAEKNSNPYAADDAKEMNYFHESEYWRSEITEQKVIDFYDCWRARFLDEILSIARTNKLPEETAQLFDNFVNSEKNTRE